MSIRVGFIGYGGIASAHQQSVVLSGMGQIVGGMDIDPKQRQRFEEQVKAPSFSCYKKMLDKTKPDAVVVTTPPNARLDIIGECVNRGLAVLCEKPLAHNAESARKLVEISSNAKNACAVGYCHRFNPGINRIKQMLADGTLGEPIEFINFFASPCPWIGELWRTDTSISGGGCLSDNGSHSLDIFQYVFGPIKNFAGATRYGWPGRGDDSSFILLVSENGIAGQITVSWMYPHSVCTVEVVGTKGSAKFDYANIDELKIHIGKEDWKVEKIAKDTRFVDQMKAFLGAVRNGQMGRLATFEDGLAVAEIVESVYKNKL